MKQPLAARMRPKTLSDFMGQSHMLHPESLLLSAYTQGNLHSMILWGPPGTGKTTLALLLAQRAQAHVEHLSAVTAGVKDIRAVVTIASEKQTTDSTVVFIDEIHRFNKSQQDALLPHIESGLLTLIGATTENPSFELNNALLSRVQVYVLRSLDEASLKQILTQAIHKLSEEEGMPIHCEDGVLNTITMLADGDARQALNLLEKLIFLVQQSNEVSQVSLTQATLDKLNAQQLRRFDKKGEYFYDLISALHKSVRGSDPDAALYWLARMLEAGCDPRYIARRVLRMASEDIGNADPRALTIASEACDVYERLGSPEGELAIAQSVVYLACAPKSNAVYVAFNKAMQSVKAQGSLPVPDHLCNAPTTLLKSINKGKAYRYAHDEPHAYVAKENYFPIEMRGNKKFYEPVQRGLEIKIAEKLSFLKTLDEKGKV